VPAPATAPSGYDRVGGSRLTGLGAVLVGILLLVALRPPQAVDDQLVALLLVAVASVITIGVLWPIVSLRRITVAVDSRRDAVVGEEVPIDIVVSGLVSTCEVRALDPTGRWHRVAGEGLGTLSHLADRRGVFSAVRIELRSTAPLGVMAAHRVFSAVLPAPISVAPRPLAVDWFATGTKLEGTGDPRPSDGSAGEVVRSVRPYAAGDPAHLVHWPSTARSGSLVVKELEPPSAMGQAIVVDLRDLGEHRERAASYAAGAARAVLAAGGTLVLCTAEESGPRSAPATSMVEVGRRLARAIEGAPAAAPEGWPVVEIGR
jgi:uncharacterized protein (DUF58 family)